MSEKPDSGDGHEEDLLADFRDVLGDADDKNTAGADTDDGMAELDAFLNEFGQGGDSTAAAVDMEEPAADVVDLDGDEDIPELHAEDLDGGLDTPELQADDMELGEDIPELHDEVVQPVAQADELNLDVDAGPDTMDDAVEETESEPFADMEPASSHDTGSIDDLFDTPITAVAPPDDDYVDDDADELVAEETPSRRAPGLDVSSVGVALFSLIIAAVVGWFAVTLHVQVGDLRAELAQLRQQEGTATMVGTGNDTARLEEEIGRLNQRINEMSLSLNAPTASPADSNQRELETIYNRLDELGKAVESLREQQARAGSKPAETAKAEPAATKPAAAKSVTKPRRGSWVVNVASLTDAASAAAEQKRLKKAGIDTEVQKAVMEGHTWFRVRVTGFASREEAQAYADMAKGKLEGNPWVGQQ